MLTVQDLHKSYQAGNTRYEVLKGISFHVQQNEFVAVLGPSGSGKTTMFDCISCCIPYDKGEIHLGNMRLASLSEDEQADVRNRKLGFVFQDFMLLDSLTMKENIMLPRIIAGKANYQTEESADRLCQIFGIAHLRGKYPLELSGRERQHAAVARALINNPLAILADEPTGNLDSNASASVMESLKQAQAILDATILMATHDSFVASHCDRVLIMKDGAVHSDIKNPGDLGRFQDMLLESLKKAMCEGAEPA